MTVSPFIKSLISLSEFHGFSHLDLVYISLYLDLNISFFLEGSETPSDTLILISGFNLSFIVGI